MDCNPFHCVCKGCLIRCRCDGLEVSYGRRRCHTDRRSPLFYEVPFFLIFRKDVVFLMGVDVVPPIASVLVIQVSIGMSY